MLEDERKKLVAKRMLGRPSPQKSTPQKTLWLPRRSASSIMLAWIEILEKANEVTSDAEHFILDEAMAKVEAEKKQQEEYEEAEKKQEEEDEEAERKESELQEAGRH